MINLKHGNFNNLGQSQLLIILIISAVCVFLQTNEVFSETEKTEISSSIDTIRVGLVIEKKDVIIKTSGYFEILDVKNDEVIATGEDSLMDISGSVKGIYIGKKCVGKNFLRIISRRYIEVNGRRYRGRIYIKMNKNCNITVINELGLEEYVCGVVPLEISSKSSIEALRAQAVASRTYAYNNKLKNKDKDFDLTPTVMSQVYGGVDGERETTTNAVDSTSGLVLVYNNEIIYAAFHSNCGGNTEDSKSVWKVDLLYLKSVRCSYCDETTHSNWSLEISANSIRNALRNNKYLVGRIDDIKVIELNNSGRVEQLGIKHSDGYTIISGAKFRMAVGYNIIRSANFEVENKISKFLFTGKGWGHGVGLCQDGAAKMAESGYNFTKILEKYYTNASIVKIKR